MYESDNLNFDVMSCTWTAGGMISMIFKRLVAKRGGKKNVQNCHET